MIKKNFIIIFVVLAGIAFGFFWYAPVSTFYIANNHSSGSYKPQLLNVRLEDAADSTGNLAIPTIKPMQNITEGFAKSLAEALINKNSEPQTGGLLPNPGLNAPSINEMTDNFIKTGLVEANKNILNINPPKLTVSYDNSKGAITNYLSQIQNILNKNLNGESLLDTLDEINKNNGQGVEKLYPIISAHEIAAKQIEDVPVPSNLKDLIFGEVQMLRITANVLKPFTDIENDPMAALAAIGQFQAMFDDWRNLQNQYNAFVQKLNQSR